MRVSVVRRIVQFAAVLLVATALGRPLAAQTGSIEGRVSDSTGVIVVGAVVSMADGGYQTTTSSRGRFSFGGVAAGRQVLRVRAIGYDPESLDVTGPKRLSDHRVEDAAPVIGVRLPGLSC